MVAGRRGAYRSYSCLLLQHALWMEGLSVDAPSIAGAPPHSLLRYFNDDRHVQQGSKTLHAGRFFHPQILGPCYQTLQAGQKAAADSLLDQLWLVSKHNSAYELSLCLDFRRVLFFFQAEDGIRDHCVTGVQTCALPIWPSAECNDTRRQFFGKVE